MLKAAIQKLLNSMGVRLVPVVAEFTPDELAILAKVKGLTATGPGRVVGLIDAVRYVTANHIEGAIVECGVWRGGSIMAALYALQDLGDISREIYLYDTFEGMSPPSEKDVMLDGTPANAVLLEGQRQETAVNQWCYCGIDTVRRNILATGYPAAASPRKDCAAPARHRLVRVYRA